jgi:outer membrane protein with beta-barrel domain
MKRLTGAMMVGAVAMLVAGAPGSANAQARGYVQLGPGVAIPVGDYKDAGAKTGWLAQVAGGVTSGVIGGRISGSYIRNGSEGSDEHIRIVGAMGDVTVSPRTAGKAAPYVLAGIGFQNGKSSLSGAEGSTKFAWNAGAGVGVQAGGFGLFLEGRFLSVRTEGSSTNLIPITVGVRLGGH